MDALTLLREDHRHVKRLLAKLETATGRGVKARAAMLSQIKDQISIHETLEEQILYPAIERRDPAGDVMREGFEEHDVVDNLVGQLEDLSPSDDRWGATATRMRMSIERHVAEEERSVFGRARRIFDPGELRRLGDRMADRKRTIEWQMSRYR
jgi:hemerythrin-like domain-containing protein